MIERAHLEEKTNEELLTEGFLTNLLNKPLRSHSDREKMNGLFRLKS